MPSPTAPVLILDESPGDRGLLRSVLMRIAPRRPLHDVGDPAAALAWMEARRGRGGVRLVLDWRLGNQNGGEVLATLRARPAFAGSRIVVVSGVELPPEDQARALTLGAESCRVKPVTLAQWDRLAREILETPLRPGMSPHPSGEGGITIDLGTAMSHTANAESLLPAISIPGLSAIFERLRPEELFAELSRFFGTRQLSAPSQAVLSLHSSRRDCLMVLGELCERQRLTERDAMIGPVPGQEWSQDKRNRRRLVIREMLGRGCPRELVQEFFGASRATAFRLLDAARKKA